MIGRRGFDLFSSTLASIPPRLHTMGIGSRSTRRSKLNIRRIGAGVAYQTFTIGNATPYHRHSRNSLFALIRAAGVRAWI